MPECCHDRVTSWDPVLDALRCYESLCGKIDPSVEKMEADKKLASELVSKRYKVLDLAVPALNKLTKGQLKAIVLRCRCHDRVTSWDPVFSFSFNSTQRTHAQTTSSCWNTLAPAGEAWRPPTAPV
jgi:hypothetical protein